MAGYAIWINQRPSYFSGSHEWDFSICYEKVCLDSFDDILVYSMDLESHIKHLEVVLITLINNHLFAKYSKCSFGMTQIKYLGHLVSAEGVQMDKTKVEAIMQWQVPKNIKQLRGFLGLSGYYRRFIHKYATLASLLTDLLKKDNFLWTDEAQETFLKLKQEIVAAPALKLPDFS